MVDFSKPGSAIKVLLQRPAAGITVRPPTLVAGTVTLLAPNSAPAVQLTQVSPDPLAPGYRVDFYLPAAAAGQQGIPGRPHVVDVASSVNAPISGLFTEDGIALTAGMRVGRFGQTNQVENGKWIASAAAWARAASFATPAEGDVVLVLLGSVNGGSQWFVTTPSPNVGILPLNFILSQGVRAWLATLPTTLPASPGLPWLNGGMLSVS